MIITCHVVMTRYQLNTIKRIRLMAKRKNTATDTIAVASIKDLGTQFGTLTVRGKALATAALKVWPALATDFAKGDKDGWAQFDNGTRIAYDATHTAPVAVRDERGNYSLVAPGEGVEGTHVTAGYLSSLSPADWAKRKNDSPSLWEALDSVREKVGNYIRDNRRNLRDNVKKVMGGAGRKARHGNRVATEAVRAAIDALKAKIKLDLDRKNLDKADFDRITAWLLDGEKLLKKG